MFVGGHRYFHWKTKGSQIHTPTALPKRLPWASWESGKTRVQGSSDSCRHLIHLIEYKSHTINPMDLITSSLSMLAANTCSVSTGRQEQHHLFQHSAVNSLGCSKIKALFGWPVTAVVPCPKACLGLDLF